VVELRDNRFFIATLYLPQIGASETPHALIDAYLRAVAGIKQ
jgi:hypothetical protein